MRSPLQQARERRAWSQEFVADQLRHLGEARGYNVGIDANAVSRHERGAIARPRPPYPELYAALYSTTVEALWPGTMVDMERRRFLQALAATPVAAMLPGDDDLGALVAITAGLRRLEPTTPSQELWSPVLAHLNLVGGRASRGPRYATAAAEVARFAAWLAWDRCDQHQARALYGRAVKYAERSRDEVVAAYMLGSMALWAAETGDGVGALRIGRRVQPAQPITTWHATMRATVASSVHDADEALAALKDAEQSLARQIEQEPRQGIYPFDYRKLQGYVGRCYTMLGLNKAAVPALREALEGMPPTKYRAVLLLDLAQSLNGDAARELIAEARQIGTEQRSQKVLARI